MFGGIDMLFCKTSAYTNQNKLVSDDLFSIISDKISYDIAYRVKKKNNQIIMKPVNNLILYNSFKPLARITCSQDSIILNVCHTKSSIFVIIFEPVFVIFLDLITIAMKLYLTPEWLLALSVAHIVTVVLIVCAQASLSYFYKKIDKWFKNEIVN